MENTRTFIILKNIIRFWKRFKFVIVFVIFALYISFIDDTSLHSQAKQQAELQELQKKKDYYLNDIEKNTNRLTELKTNNENLEKFAREQYLMRKPNEEVFVIQRK